MKNKNLIYYLLLAVLLTACKSYIPSQGKFFEGKVLSSEKYFVHDLHQEPNQLVKIGDPTEYGDLGYGYYSWKTIRTVYILSNEGVALNEKRIVETPVSVYSTIINDSLLKFSNDKLAYIQKETNVRINNLYFIDDYRCIYLSYDDTRVKSTETIIPLFFDNKNYLIKKKLKKRFEQYLRGYYTIDGDHIFFHFESPYEPRYNYFVKAAVKNDCKTIEFISSTIPNSTTELYEDGYNVNLQKFKDIFHKDAQPVFEAVEPIIDLVFLPQSQVSLGFELVKNKNKLNPLHRKLLDKYAEEINARDTLILNNVTYHYVEDEANECESRYRVYNFHNINNPNRKFEVQECIGFDEFFKPIRTGVW